SGLRGRKCRSLPYGFDAADGDLTPDHDRARRLISDTASHPTHHRRIAIWGGSRSDRWWETIGEVRPAVSARGAPGRPRSAHEQQADHVEDFFQREPT